MPTERIEIKADPDVIAAWQSHFKEDAREDKGMTASELAKLFNRSESTMRCRLREGVRKGLYTKGMATRVRSDGQPIRIAVYQPVETPKGKKVKTA